MIVISFSEKSVKSTHTYELTCTAEGGSPFVRDASGDFLNIASPADMLLLPDAPTGDSTYRDSEIVLIFRDSDTVSYTKDNIIEQIAQLNTVTLNNVSGAVLFSNV